MPPSRRAAVLLALAVAAAAAIAGRAEPTSSDPGAAPSGRIVQSLFRFPAARLGPEFAALLDKWQVGYLHANNETLSAGGLPAITPEAAGIQHALQSVSTDAATAFRRQCYGNSPRTLRRDAYRNFEQRRKEISFEYMKDPYDEMEKMHTATKRSYHAFLDEHANNADAGKGTARVHKKRTRSTVNTIHAQSTLPSDYDHPSKLSFQTFSDDNDDKNTNGTKPQRWSWHPPAYFTSRGTGDIPFRKEMFYGLRQSLQTALKKILPKWKGFEYGRQSGLFWYPPGGIREWHSNYLDLVGHMKGGGSKQEEKIFATQVWRMYAVRTVRDETFDAKLRKVRKAEVDGGINDLSAMHIIPGDDAGVTLEVLQKAGARPLTKEEKKRQWSDEFAEDYPSGEDAISEANEGELDRDAVWRIPDQDGYVTLFRLPELWHCIVSEEVHRYSLGFAFSDTEVQALLSLAGEQFDTQDTAVDAKDEL